MRSPPGFLPVQGRRTPVLRRAALAFGKGLRLAPGAEAGVLATQHGRQPRGPALAVPRHSERGVPLRVPGPRQSKQALPSPTSTRSKRARYARGTWPCATTAAGAPLSAAHLRSRKAGSDAGRGPGCGGRGVGRPVGVSKGYTGWTHRGSTTGMLAFSVTASGWTSTRLSANSCRPSTPSGHANPEAAFLPLVRNATLCVGITRRAR